MSLTTMKLDTDAILSEWGETLTVHRLSDPSYDDEGKANRDDDQWTEVGEITGDYQPLPGSAISEEQGLESKSEAQVFTVFDADVEDGDRIYRADDTYMIINYIRKFEDHCLVRLKRINSRRRKNS